MGPGDLPSPLRITAHVLFNRVEGGLNRRLGLALARWPTSEAGQFVMLSPGPLGPVWRSDPLLPRPMAVYRERRAGAGAELEILYKLHGRGTQLIASARVGDALALVGPLGRGFALAPPGAPAILVGGGTGIASLYALARELAARGPVQVLFGARSADDLMGVSDFEGLPVELACATEDGSRGARGLATALLEQRLARATPGDASPWVYACGPTPMMRRCAALCAERGVRCAVSLEQPMACGFGVCLGCAAPLAGGGVALVCRDGPVFDAARVDWEGLR